MKFTVAAILAALAATSFAQDVSIICPLYGGYVTPGQELNVSIKYGSELSGGKFYAEIKPCNAAGMRDSLCIDEDYSYGYSYPFLFNDPGGAADVELEQNFTLTISPDILKSSNASLSGPTVAAEFSISYNGEADPSLHGIVAITLDFINDLYIDQPEE